MEYRTVRGSGQHLDGAMKDLDDKVTELLAEGWVPCGGVAVLFLSTETVENRRYSVCQAVTLSGKNHGGPVSDPISKQSL